MSVPRPEYPRPLIVRDRWLNLNGRWNFDVDPADRGLSERWHLDHAYPRQITVPYAPGSDASGVALEEQPAVVWYERTFEVPGDWHGSQVRLNVGACDFHATAFVNGQEVGRHQGGYTPFSFDVTHALAAGLPNRLSVRVADGPSWSQPRGKQEGTTRWPIDYDAVIGIWQTVWLEPVGECFVTDLAPRFTCADDTVSLTAGLSVLSSGTLHVGLSVNGTAVVEARVELDRREEARLSFGVPDPHLWSPDDPFLYDLRLELSDVDGRIVDSVDSYLGLREIGVDGDGLRLNGEPLYLRGVLDQGYFPDGWYTAVDDAAFEQDVQLTRALGFNCARKHQKAEDPRYLYWADRLGLLVWSEMPSGRIFASALVGRLTTEWLALVRRDRAHPSVIAWVPFNESWGVWHQAERTEQRAFVDGIARLTKALDPSRPVIANDGWEYSAGDLWTFHAYDGAGSLAAKLAALRADPTIEVAPGRVGRLEGASVAGLGVLLTECGGVGFVPTEHAGETFAYGDLPGTADELENRLRDIAGEVTRIDGLGGFVWTQLTDVQQEVNGLLYFDRTPKLPLETLCNIFDPGRG